MVRTGEANAPVGGLMVGLGTWGSGLLEGPERSGFFSKGVGLWMLDGCKSARVGARCVSVHEGVTVGLLVDVCGLLRSRVAAVAAFVAGIRGGTSICCCYACLSGSNCGNGARSALTAVT